MSGKSYTLNEMKAIVDYLTEHKAYGEIKGRKMWMDLQDSKITNRTWQSLKETFMKRILPDITNPYYKLSMQQITSFKQGYDIEKRINNRLEIRSVSNESNTEGENQKSNDKPNSSEIKEGENAQQSNRSSTETLVLDDYDEPEAKQNESQSKTLRDLITYSEPLTPMLQSVIDYTSEGDEPRMLIIDPSENEPIQTNEALLVVLEGSDSEEYRNNDQSKTDVIKAAVENTDTQHETDQNKIEIEEQTSGHTNNKTNNDESSIILTDGNKSTNEKDTIEPKASGDENLNTQSKSTLNTTNSITDTFLPDNQEALDDKESKSKNTNTTSATTKVTSSKRGRKRAISQDANTTGKWKLLNTVKKTNSDIDTLKIKKDKIDLKKLKENISNISLVKEPSKSDHQRNSNNDQAELNYPKKTDGNKQEESNKIEKTNKNHEQKQEKFNNQGTHTVTDQQAEVDITKNIEQTAPLFDNPCLKSVSLYEEQFSNKKYTESDSTEAEKNIPDKHKSIKVDNKTVNTEVPKAVKVSADINEIVILRSHSDSESEPEKVPVSRVPDKVRQQREHVLTNLFRFTSGGVSKNTRRGSFQRRSTSRRKSRVISIDSSDGTSDTGSEYISPPRGRKNKHARKYLRPKSTRVLSLDEEGGLFVMHGKRIYPVVKDGKIIKNYVSLTAEDDIDLEESSWKLKYVEEKKRNAELLKMLNQIKEKNIQESRVPEVPSTSLLTPQNIQSPVKSETENKISDLIPAQAAQVGKAEATAEGKTIKVKFTKNNEEVQLEGHWAHVPPVLAQVLQLLQDTRSDIAKPEAISEVSSVKSSSVVANEQEVRERVDKLEREIFKVIEQKEVEDDVPVEKPLMSSPSDSSTDKNITKRRSGRPKKSGSSSEPSTPKKAKRNSENDEGNTVAARRTPRTLRNTTESNNVNENNTPKTRQTAGNKSNKKGVTASHIPEVRYKLPSPTKHTKDIKNTTLRKSISLTRFKMYSSPDSITQNSNDSTQGYVDSDPSPVKMLRKKRKMSFTIPALKMKYQLRKPNASHPYLTDDVSSESSNSFQGPLTTVTFRNSSHSSEIYKSDSYEILMNNNTAIRNKNIPLRLDRIDEHAPVPQETQLLSDRDDETVFESQKHNSLKENEKLCVTNTDSSSNMTLPTSPALSIVENISINKSMLNNTDYYTFNDELTNGTDKITLNNLMKADVDVSMPLMQQECDISSAAHDGMEYHYNLTVPKESVVSESLLKKIDTVNIEERTSESINDQLRNMILESTKKVLKEQYNAVEPMEQDLSSVMNTKKTKSKKRSSTPRKRQSTCKLKFAQNEPCIEEEHMETFSQVSRNSCPPNVQLFEDINNNHCVTSVINNDKPKTRKKKDVIKVKILKPIKRSKVVEDANVKDKKQSFTQADSGINDTGSIHMQISEDSVDLIHNHSETCLNAHECLDPSIEIVENSRSVMSIDSKSAIIDLNNNNITSNDVWIDELPEILAHELHSCDAQDGTQIDNAKSDSILRQKSAETTVSHTPLGSLSPPNSLMTEDLSDEQPPQPRHSTKWYLFSEDETTNTVDVDQDFQIPFNGGADLNQIFPVSCAVPNLSTITEMSKDNEENTRKFNEDTNSRDIDLESLFTNY